MDQAQARRVEQAVAGVLETARVRFTPVRRRVVRALAETRGPVAAATLHEGLRSTVPLSSLYRSLAVLEAARVLAKEHGTDGVARYELAEWLTGHHHHLVCVSCGEVRDVAVDPATERAITRLVTRLAAAQGYRVGSHRIDIEGTCPACAAA
jgi:Fur family ferric uptake transcriptional regulator